jgi:AraC family transcriptional regulator, arabinose operon regulatory protein
MVESMINMDETNIRGGIGKRTEPDAIRRYSPIRSEKFRTPVGPERELGLWVDRIGGGSGGTGAERPRILGLYAVVTVVSGKGTFCSGNIGEMEVGRDDVLFVFPEVVSGYNPVVGEGWDTRFVVWGGPEAVRLEHAGIIDPDEPVVRGAGSSVLYAYERLDTLMDDWGPIAALKRRIVLEEMVSDLASHKSGMDNPTTDYRVIRVAEYIRRNISKPMRVSEPASLVSLSTTHLRRLFTSEMGCGMKEFQLAERLNYAKDALARGRPVKKVAPEVGYPDEFYFRRLFRQKVGMTPGEFVSGMNRV